MRWISLNPEFRGCAKVMRDGAKSRFVALFSARMTASAINSENCRQGSSYQPIGRTANTASPLCCEISKWTASFAVPAYRARCSRASATVVGSRGKVDKDTSVSQIHFRCDVQPEEGNRSSRSRRTLGTDAATRRKCRQNPATTDHAKAPPSTTAAGIDPITVQVAQGFPGGGAAAPQKRALRDLASGNAPHSRTFSKLLSSNWPDLSRSAVRAEPINRLPAGNFILSRSPRKDAANMNLSNLST